MDSALKRLLVVVIITMLALASGCSGGQKDNSLRQENPQSIASPSPAVAPHGIDTNSPTVSDRVTLNCFVDADRGDDFIVHGNFHLPGTSPEGQDITTGRFQIVSPAADTVREELRGSVGQTVSLFGKLDSTYGTDRGLFIPVSLKPSSQAISPPTSWIGWGRIDSTQAGQFFKCTESAALTDWVSALAGLADALGLPKDGKDVNISEFLAQVEKNNRISAMKYKTQHLLPTWPLVYADDKALADLRSGAGQFSFVTSASSLQNMLVRRADVKENEVAQFMTTAIISGYGDGPHKKEPATIFGYAQLGKNAIYVKGVEGDSFSQWMDIFRGKSSGYKVMWEALGVPDFCFSYDEPVFCWFTGWRIQDNKTKQWFFSVKEVLPAKRYSRVIDVLSALE